MSRVFDLIIDPADLTTAARIPLCFRYPIVHSCDHFSIHALIASLTLIKAWDPILTLMLLYPIY